MTEEEIYRRFIDWLNKTWWGVPESPELMPLIKARYSPEEAALLTGMPYSAKNLEELAGLKEMDPADLRAQLLGQRDLYEAALREGQKDLDHRRNELRALEATVREEEEEIGASRQALRELESIMQRIRNRVGRSL